MLNLVLQEMLISN